MTTPAVDVQSVQVPDNGLRIGTCTAVGLTTVTISVQGTPIDCGVLDSYTPIVGDVVAILRGKSSWLALGSIHAAGGMLADRQSGIASVSFTALASFSQVVSFNIPFRTVPAVYTNINSGAGSTASWNSRAINIGTNGFTLFVFGPASTWASVPVGWTAFSM